MKYKTFTIKKKTQTQNEDLPLHDNLFKTGVTLMNFIDAKCKG